MTFVSVGYKLCIFTAKVRFGLGVIEPKTKQNTSEIGVLYDVLF